MSLAENQKRTAQAFMDGYDEWTVEALMRVRADYCVHVMLPASLGRPDYTNEEYAELFGRLAPVMEGFKITMLKVVNAPEEHMAVVHARGSAETVAGPYRNEYVFFLTFNDDGTKIVKIEEFVDSAFIQGLVPKLQEHLAKQSGKQ